jgi:hypothetical protein
VRSDQIECIEQWEPARPFTCPDHSRFVSCEFSNAEPLDVPVSTVCSSGALPVKRAGTAVIESSEKTDLTILWLNVQESGRVAGVATRHATIVRRMPILVSQRPERFIQFTRLGASPVTISSTQLFTENTWRLPDGVPGGEILVGVEDAPVRPTGLRLVGPWSGDLAVSDGRATSLAGLPPGLYQLTTMYAGDVPGGTQSARVEAEASVHVNLPRESVGGVHVALGDTLCDQLPSDAAFSIADQKGQVRARPLFARVCTAMIGGLEPAEYELVMQDSQRVLVRQTFAVIAQRVSSVSLDVVRAHGLVSVNGRPLPDATLHFRRSDAGTSESNTIAITDVNGLYEAVLPEPGLYRVAFETRGIELLGQERDVALRVGNNHVNYPIEGGTLTIDVEGWDAVRPVDIRLTRAEPITPGIFSVGRRVKDRAELPIVIDGLGFGTLLVQARVTDQPPMVSPSLTVTLDPQQPWATLTLDLREYKARVRLLDPAGKSVTGARLSTMEQEALPEIAPGIYSLESTAPGAQVTIRAADYTPLCRRAPALSELTVVLNQGIVVEFIFSGYANLTKPPGRVTWPDTECPVALESFAYTQQSLTTEGARFTIERFPYSAALWYIRGAFDTEADWLRLDIGPGAIARIDRHPR